MKWRWLLFDYADPDLPLTIWQRIKVAGRLIPIWKLPRSARRARLFSVLIGLAPFGVGPLAISAIGTRSAGTGLFFLATVLFIASVWIWACLIYGVFGRHEYYHRVRLEGFDICANCGYWLRGLGDDVKQCPKCGTKREPMADTPRSRT